MCRCPSRKAGEVAPGIARRRRSAERPAGGRGRFAPRYGFTMSKSRTPAPQSIRTKINSGKFPASGNRRDFFGCRRLPATSGGCVAPFPSTHYRTHRKPLNSLIPAGAKLNFCFFPAFFPGPGKTVEHFPTYSNSVSYHTKLLRLVQPRHEHYSGGRRGRRAATTPGSVSVTTCHTISSRTSP